MKQTSYGDSFHFLQTRNLHVICRRKVSNVKVFSGIVKKQSTHASGFSGHALTCHACKIQGSHDGDFNETKALFHFIYTL